MPIYVWTHGCAQSTMNLAKMDRKTNLLELLVKYQTPYIVEARYIPRFKHLLAQPLDPFSRLNPQAHITGSAILFDRRIEAVYQIWHAKVGRWLQPGGHVEDDDFDTHAAALRELLEETGFDRGEIRPFGSEIFDVDIHVIGSGATAHEHFDVRFAFEFVGDLKMIPIPPARWYPLTDLMGDGDKSQARYAKKISMMLCSES